FLIGQPARDSTCGRTEDDGDKKRQHESETRCLGRRGAANDARGAQYVVGRRGSSHPRLVEPSTTNRSRQSFSRQNALQIQRTPSDPTAPFRRSGAMGSPPAAWNVPTS